MIAGLGKVSLPPGRGPAFLLCLLALTTANQHFLPAVGVAHPVL